jgi:hypothetical protein
MTRSNNSRRGLQKSDYFPNKHTITAKLSARSVRYQLAADADDWFSYANDSYDFESSDEESLPESTAIHLLLLNTRNVTLATKSLAVSSGSGCPDWSHEWSFVGASSTEGSAASEKQGPMDWVIVDTPSAERCGDCHDENTTDDQAIAELLSADELAESELRLGSPNKRRNPPCASSSSSVPAAGWSGRVLRTGISEFSATSLPSDRTLKHRLQPPSASSSSKVPAASPVEVIRAGFAHFPATSLRRGRALQHRLPSRHQVDALTQRLGACIVCRDSVATLLMEPCGHLALCGACYESWAARCGARSSSCVYCRTPGTAIQLISRATAGDSAGDLISVCVRLTDGLITTHSSIGETSREDSKTRNLTLDYKRAKRNVYREASSHPVPDFARRVSTEEDPGGWMQYERDLQSWKRRTAKRRALLAAVQSADRATRDAAIQEFEQTCSQYYSVGRRAWWRQNVVSSVPPALVVKLLSMPSRRPDLPICLKPVYHYYSKRKVWVGEQKHKLQSQLDKTRFQRRQASKWRAENSKASAAVVTDALATALSLVDTDTACIDCGCNEACMLAHPCQHVALCRPCWEARPRENETCARCGVQSKYALCVRRP